MGHQSALPKEKKPGRPKGCEDKPRKLRQPGDKATGPFEKDNIIDEMLLDLYVEMGSPKCWYLLSRCIIYHSHSLAGSTTHSLTDSTDAKTWLIPGLTPKIPRGLGAYFAIASVKPKEFTGSPITCTVALHERKEPEDKSDKILTRHLFNEDKSKPIPEKPNKNYRQWWMKIQTRTQVLVLSSSFPSNPRWSSLPRPSPLDAVTSSPSLPCPLQTPVSNSLHSQLKIRNLVGGWWVMGKTPFTRPKFGTGITVRKNTLDTLPHSGYRWANGGPVFLTSCVTVDILSSYSMLLWRGHGQAGQFFDTRGVLARPSKQVGSQGEKEELVRLRYPWDQLEEWWEGVGRSRDWEERNRFDEDCGPQHLSHHDRLLPSDCSSHWGTHRISDEEPWRTGGLSSIQSWRRPPFWFLWCRQVGYRWRLSQHSMKRRMICSRTWG